VPAEEVTAEVSETTLPVGTEFGTAVRLVLVDFALTMTVTAVEVLGAKLAVC
jgi:hypothetical protein